MTTQNVEFLEKRDKEIREVLKSIEDVNEIFRDVAALISNQVSRDLLGLTVIINEISRALFSIKLNTMLKIRLFKSNKEINI